MGTYIKVGLVSDYQNGMKKKVSVNGQEILLSRVGDKYYAVSNRCPHMGGDLSLGTLEGTVITCPRHGSQFDISGGQVLRWMKGSGLAYTLGKTLKPPQNIQTYKVKVEGENILVEV